MCEYFCWDKSHKQTRSVYNARSRTQEKKEQTKSKYTRRNRMCSKLHRRISTMNDSMFSGAKAVKGAYTEAGNTSAISRRDKSICMYGYIEKRRKMPLYECVRVCRKREREMKKQENKREDYSTANKCTSEEQKHVQHSSGGVFDEDEREIVACVQSDGL